MTEALQKFNRLKIISNMPGKKGPPQIHPTSICLCDCGNKRIARTTDVKRGKVIECVSCARKTASLKVSIKMSFPDEKRKIHRIFGHYKSNAKRKNIKFSLSIDECKLLLKGNCFYCGEPAGFGLNGIDRKNNLGGYVISNCVSCCSVCNYAKRDMQLKSFLDWVSKIYNNLN